jgi:HEXXH motif-containing protein
LHIIKPLDIYYDVSFSEPRVPFSIFFSVPENRIANDALRVAEAIVHEAMHIQLTLIEQIVPLIRSDRITSNGKKYFSPWRRTHRPAHGILHGLYVFRIIVQFLASLSCTGSNTAMRRHIQGRQKEIERQIAKTHSFEQSSELTLIGVQLVQALLNPTRSSGFANASIYDDASSTR